MDRDGRIDRHLVSFRLLEFFFAVFTGAPLGVGSSAASILSISRQREKILIRHGLIPQPKNFLREMKARSTAHARGNLG